MLCLIFPPADLQEELKTLKVLRILEQITSVLTVLIRISSCSGSDQLAADRSDG